MTNGILSTLDAGSRTTANVWNWRDGTARWTHDELAVEEEPLGIRVQDRPISILPVSGRSSFEIVQKALTAAIPIVAAVSAPSRLAVEFTSPSGRTLVGFVREGRANVHTHSCRVTAGDFDVAGVPAS